MTLPELLKALHHEAGASGMIEILRMLQHFDTSQLRLPHPQPMFFQDAWEEVFAAIVKAETE